MLEDLKRWAITKEKQNRSETVFLSLKKDIQEAINAGWYKKHIWQYLTENNKIKCSYVLFNMLCKKHLTPKNKTEAATTKQEKTPTILNIHIPKDLTF